MKGRYRGNLAGEERIGGDKAGVGPLGSVSSPASFVELSKARFKVITRFD